MSHTEKLEALEANRPRLEAKDLLQRALLGEVQLSANGWYDVTLLATGDVEEAEKNCKAYIKACQDAGRDPA